MPADTSGLAPRGRRRHAVSLDDGGQPAPGKLGRADDRIKNRHNERAVDLLPPHREGADPSSDDEKVRAMIRRAQAETQVAAAGDVVEGELSRGSADADDDDDVFDPNDVASDSD